MRRAISLIPTSKTSARFASAFWRRFTTIPIRCSGNHMLNGAKLAIDEANAAGGYGGKPFRLVTHNDYDNWQISRLLRWSRQRIRNLGRSLERCRPDDL